ncbi:DUF4150 domain-containing protein [Maribius pontilimi]|uniref:DUF4150 domain-containing protein n=1 Tax=Palleronia pontilimi TaxID=1964209 RepID=A0A934ILW8_9RHOB|nr:PAAR-like domain-containing protein [Palleronia pontilimi]MBJ3764444.1 DUF4150 domain-containing protein [Palleronia pontilimi]
MGKPITTASSGTCVAFPNVCKTPVPTPAGPQDVPIPYPSIGQLSSAEKQSGDPTVFAGGDPVVTTDFEIADTTGDAAGTSGGVKSGGQGGPVTFPSGSGSVNAQTYPVVRMFDQTEQNDGNCTGTCLGGIPTIRVGG